MSETFRCEDKERLVEYLYGEIDAEGRREAERHIRGCAACARESEELHAVRRNLEAWLPPEPELGFTIVQKPATVLRPRGWSSESIPAWARVAAAVLIVGIAAAVANLRVRYDREGLMVTTGWMQSVPPGTPTPVTAAAEDWRPALIALERDLRSELTQMRRVAAAALVDTNKIAQPAPVDTATILRRVEAMLEESEQRQEAQLALRLLQVRREVDQNRQADLMRVQRSFGSLQGRAINVEAGQQHLMNLMRRASLPPNQ